LNPRPAVAELGLVYPPTYYVYNYDTINPIARQAKEMLDRRKIAKIVRQCPQAPKSYLDVGCGDGRFLRVLEQLGVPRSGLYGLELDKRVVERLRGQGYSGVFCERAEDVSSFPEGGIDLVTMFHVIEHVDNPGAVIGRVRRWLSPGASLHWKRPTWTVWMRGSSGAPTGGATTSPALESFHACFDFAPADGQRPGSNGHCFSNRPLLLDVLPAPHGAL
jgi:SAM-dependent methyltransferase